MEQLALALELPVSPPNTVLSRSNGAAYKMLAGWPDWPHPVALVTGPEGAGRSHLARVFAEGSGGVLRDGASVGLEDALTLPADGVLVVDDADRASDRMVFHLINAVRANSGTMLLTARRRAVGGLADLASRLRAVPEVALEAPDDGLMRAVMAEAFARRQLIVDEAVVTFLLHRMERTLHAALSWVEALDRQGLVERRGATVPLAARLMRAGGPTLV
ncbi:MAG: hypothetical protein AAF318_11295 [Pseudomonadota bacterium]